VPFGKSYSAVSLSGKIGDQVILISDVYLMGIPTLADMVCEEESVFFVVVCVI
jgi:hypothetical protein